MSGKWRNVSAGPRQVKDLQKAMGALHSEGKAHDELYGVIGGKESRTTLYNFLDPMRPEVVALDAAIKERYGYEVTKDNVRQIIADYAAVLPEARTSRPTEDTRRTPEEEAERVAASAARDAEYQAKRDAESAVLNAVMAKAPRGAKALIYAEYRVDNSDIQTDYFNSRTARTVAIGWRFSSREDFRALRAAAAGFPETAHMASEETLAAWQQAEGWRIRDDLEHRDNHSMGAGNYLSDHGWAGSGTGWLVKSCAIPCGYLQLTEDAIPDTPAATAPGASPTVRGPRGKAISGDVLDILSRATADGNALRIADRLDRATYVAVNEVLTAAGGKWNRSAQAHLFPSDAATVLAGLLADGTIVRPQDEGYFPTPAVIVADILLAADLVAGMEVLEPSAGDGAIAGVVAAQGCTVDCIEFNDKRADALRAAGYARSVTTADFLTVPCRAVYDRVLMNPPFAGKADIAHVMHALGFVKPGGLLVAVMAAGVTFREDFATADFREVVDECGGYIAPLPDDAFKGSGTGVRTVLVTIPVAADCTQAA